MGVLHAHTSDLVALAFSPDDALLCSVGYDGRRRLQVRLVEMMCVDADSDRIKKRPTALSKTGEDLGREGALWYFTPDW